MHCHGSLVQRTGAHCWLGEGEQEEGKSLTGERGWRQAPVLATGGSSVVRIEARRRPALVLRSTQKKEASSKLEHGRRSVAVCVSCSLVRRAIAGGQGVAGRWRLVSAAIRAIAGELEERATMAVEVLACRKEKKKRRAQRALIVEKAGKGLEGEQDLPPTAVVGGGQRRWQRRSRRDAHDALRTGEQGRCEWAGPPAYSVPFDLFK
jgi:hypothetical protein